MKTLFSSRTARLKREPVRSFCTIICATVLIGSCSSTQNTLKRKMNIIFFVFLEFIRFRLYGIYQCCGSGSGRIRSFWVSRIRILYPQKDPCNSNFLIIKLSKRQFRQKNVIFDFKCNKMFRFGKNAIKLLFI